MNRQDEFPYYMARWDKKNNVLINFTKFNNKQDEEMNSFLVHTSAIKQYSDRYLLVSYGTIKDTIDGSDPLDLTFSEEHIKDMMETACKHFGIYHPLDAVDVPKHIEEFKKFKQERMEKAECLTILSPHKDYEGEEKIGLDIFVTQRMSQTASIFAMILGAMMSRGEMGDAMSLDMGGPFKARLGSEHQLWDPILLVQNKSAVKVSSEDEMLNAVKNILEDNS